MQRLTLLILVFFVGLNSLMADRVKNYPQTIKQPNGEVIKCFTSGDEFYHRLHDANGYTIVLNPDDGYFYYGVKEGEKVVPSNYLANSVDPAVVGIPANAKISKRLYEEKKQEFTLPLKTFKDAPTSGQVNNLVVYIAFEDDSIFKKPRSYYKPYFSHEDSVSMKDYFREVSYNRLFIDTYHYPVSPDTTSIVYIDPNPRGNFLKQSATNPDGYPEGGQGRREHALLKRAIEYVDSQVPDSLAVDMNDDGRVDNVCFVMQGGRAGWSDLLWPHRWSLYNENATINGKQVWDYLLMLEGGFEVGTLCHEFFHVLGAPDLYHYDAPEGTPVACGKWDLMDSNSNPPQYMGAFMKYKYGDWISSLPVIRESGTYYLNPLSNPDRNVYKIKSPLSPYEYFVLEFRKREGRYESSAPSSGMVVYRINPNAGNGNAGGPPDEVYIYRPGGSMTRGGALTSAALGIGDRTAISDKTDPSAFLYNNGKGGPGGLDIFNVTNHGDSIGFEVSLDPLYVPINLSFVLGEGKVTLDWPTLYADGITRYNVYRNGVILDGTSSSRYVDRTIQEGENYVYTITAVYDGVVVGESDHSESVLVTPLGILEIPYSEDFEEVNHGWQVKGSTDGFRWGDAEFLKLNTDNESHFLGTNSVEAGQNTHTLDYAVSPRLNLEGQESVMLEFDYALKVWLRFDKLSLVYRRNISDDWVPFFDLPKSGVGGKYIWRHWEIEIPADAYSPETQIAFKYTDSNEFAYGSAIDNISIKTTTTGIADPNEIGELSIYPNPSNGEYELIYKANQESKSLVKVFGFDGKEILHQNIGLDGRLTIDLSNRPDGIYHLLIESQTETISRKLVKKNR